MRTAKKAMKRIPASSSKSASLADSAVNTAAKIAETFSKSAKLDSADGKINIHIHVGDIILIGFDEAIDAEEWGMRENNTEIIGEGGVASKAKASSTANADPGDNKKTARSVSFQKGDLKLNATEHAEPLNTKTSSKGGVRRKKPKAVTRKA